MTLFSPNVKAVFGMTEWDTLGDNSPLTGIIQHALSQISWPKEEPTTIVNIY